MLLVIVNPAAGNGRAKLLWEKVETCLSKKNVQYKWLLSGSEADAREFIRQHVKDFQVHTIAVIGGDGTVNAILQDVVHSEIALAILPAGSGNDIARVFNLTANPQHFVKQVLSGVTKQVDALKINSSFGLTIAGTGLDADIAERVNRAAYKKILSRVGAGSFTYSLNAILSTLTYKSFKSTVTIDDETYISDKTWMIVSGNTSSYGGGLVICPYAHPIDGVLDITLVHTAKRGKVLFQLFPLLLKGEPVLKSGVTYKKGKKITIKTSRPVSIMVDGEPIGTTPAHINVHEKAVKLVMTT